MRIRWGVRLGPCFYKRGFGAVWEWSAIGTSYGDPRSRYTYELTLWFWWPVQISGLYIRGVAPASSDQEGGDSGNASD